uniref:two-partner secretion domain-containing protein n=1 Tax=Halomonas sp. TaxID=1486246 RepID=UPI002609F6B2
MNRQCYRLIFSRAKGRWVVTSEQASRRGKGSRGEGATLTGASGLLLPLGENISALRPLCMAVLLASVGLVGMEDAQAQILPDSNAPSNQRPHVVNTANGTPQVNIQAPNRKGLSHNTYRQFDVDGKGAILNNSRNNTQTQIGGWVQANPNLAKGEARVILNEVNSRDPSLLRGPIEVAGSRADVIIANPAGLQINGSKFINASNVTLTTGNPLYRDGMINGYHVGGGKIEIAGGGLDTSDSDYTALLARAVEVQAQASLQANDLTVITGANRISADLKDVTAIQGQGAAPEVAIDVAHLGGMYANEIRLVATEAGVGVRNAGQIGARAGELRVTADGRVENTGLLQSSMSNTRLSAAGGIRNSGDVTAARELTLTTPRDIDNSHGMLSAPRLDVKADSLTNLYGEIEQTGTQALALNAGSLSNRQGGRIGLPAPDTGGGTDSGTDSGTSGGGSANGNTGGGSSGGGQSGGGSGPVPEVLADGRLAITHRLSNDAGVISAAHMDLVSSSGLNNAGGHLGLGELTLKGGNLNNQGGELIIDGPAHVQVNQVNNNAGVWQISGPLAFSARDVSNRGGTFTLSDTSATTLNVYGAVDNDRHGVFDNTQGTLASNASQLTLNTGTFYNERGTIEHAGSGGLTLNSGDLYGRDGTITTGGAMQLTAAKVDHSGATLNAEQLTLDADSFDSRGGLITLGGTQPNTLTVRQSLDNGAGGVLTSNGDLDIRAATLGNAGGQILHAGDGQLTVHTQRLNGKGGTIASNGDLGLYDGSFDLSEGTTQANRITVDGEALTTAGGSLTALSDDTLMLTTNGQIDNRAGRIATNGDLWLEALSVNNQAGTFNVFGDAHFDVAETLDNTQGDMTSGGDQSIQAATFRNVSGTVEHAGDGTLTIDTAQLNGNGGTIVSNGHLDLNGGILDLSDGTTQAQRITVDGQKLITAGGQLIALGDDTLTLATRGQLDNQGGTLQSGGAVVIDSRGLNNASGAILGTALEIDTHQQTLDNSAGGTIATIKGRANAQGTEEGHLIIHSGELNNDSGLIQSLGDMVIDTAGEALSNTRSGEKGGLISGGALTINPVDGDSPHRHGVYGNVFNDAGLISAQQALTINAAALNNRQNGVIAGADSITLNTTSLNNKSGSVQADQPLSVSVDKTLDNTAGLLASLQGDVGLTSGGKLTNDKGMIQARGLVDSASRGLANAGGAILGAQIDINTRQHALDNSNDGVIATLASGDGDTAHGDGSVTIHSGVLNNDTGLIQSQGDMRVDTAGQTLTNTHSRGPGTEETGGLISGGSLTINPISGETSGESVYGDVLNDGGWIAAQQALTVNAATLSNTDDGVIVGADTITLNATSLANQDGTVQADGTLLANVDQQIENQRGVLVSREGDVDLTSGGKLSSDKGTIQAKGKVDTQSRGLSNAGGSILGAEIDINTRKQTLDNSNNGVIATLASEDGDTAQGDDPSQGLETGHLTIHSGELNNDTGLIQSLGDMLIDTNGQTLTNTHTQAQSEDDAHRGLISGGTLTLNPISDTGVYGDVNNAGGWVFAQQALTLGTTELSNTDGGAIVGADTITLTATSLANQDGTVQADGTLTANIDQQIANQRGVLISRQGNVSLTGGDELRNDSGVIQAQGRADIISTGLSNVGGSILGAEIDINTRKQTLDNSAKGTIATISTKEGEAPTGDGASQGPETGLLTIHSGALNNDTGLIQSQGDMVIDTAGHTLTNTHSGHSNNDTQGGLISGGSLTLNPINGEGTYGDVINDSGLISAKQALIAHAGKLSNTNSGVMGGADAITLTAESLDNQGGIIQADATLTVTVDERIDNQSGTLVSLQGGVDLTSGDNLRNDAGAIQSQGRTDIISAGLSNIGGSILGTEIDINTRQQALDNSAGGTIATISGKEGEASSSDGESQGPETGHLTIHSGELNNDTGLIQSQGDMVVDTAGHTLTNTGQGSLISGSGMNLITGDINNASGLISAQQALTANIGKLNNIEGGVFGSAANVSLNARGVDNQSGQLVAEEDLFVGLDGQLDNTQGLISAGNTLTVEADSLINRDTLSDAPDHVLGLQGDTVELHTQRIDNTEGLIAADTRIDIQRLQTGDVFPRALSRSLDSSLSESLGSSLDSSLNNTGGIIASQGTLDITRNVITNTGGTLFSAGDQTLNTDTLSGDGRVLSQGDLTLTLSEAFTNTRDGEITANGKLVFDTQGKLINQGLIQAGGLYLAAAELDNTVDGVISADTTEVIINGSLTNRGLIDGGATHVQATTLDNIGSGRIYGDHLTIQAETLTNREETLDGKTASATIAARERLDMGIGTLVNQGKDSLIFSAGSGAEALNIAGKLDDQRHATGMADRVDNLGATIESLGGLNIHARELNNLNPHFTTEEVQVEGPTGYISIVGGKRYPAPGVEYDVSLFDWYDKVGGQYVKRDDAVSGFTDKPGGATYIAWNGTPPPKEDAVLGWSPTPRVADADYPLNDPAWAYFGVIPPAPEPKEPRPEAFASDEAYRAAHAQWQQAHADWKNESEQRYAALDEEIAAYNATFGTPERIDEWHQHIQDWTQFEGEKSVYETQTRDSTPGRILSGGDMALKGDTLLNDKSQIIAGGVLAADFQRIENRDAEGTRRVHYEAGGERWFTDGKHCSSNYCRSRDWELLGPWVPADETTTIDLSVARMDSHQNAGGSGHAVEDRHTGSAEDEARGRGEGPQGADLKDIAGTDQPTQDGGLKVIAANAGGQTGQIVEVAAVATDTEAGGRDITGADLNLPDTGRATPSTADGPDIAGPDGARGQALADANPDAPEVVRTLQPELSVPTSSLFQLDPAPNADVLIETDPRFTDRREWLSSDYMLKAVQQDPTTSHKRMGDGLYEQRLITEQIMRLTGQRYLDGYHNDEDQFRALMNAGLTFAAEHQLRPGIGLTAAQMAQLTSDIVWLVEREVTLADGRTENVLVPQVYVRVREGDLNGDGTLLAGDRVDVTTRGDLINSGTIAGRTAVELNADNLRNLNGRITGDSVVAHARTDIDNIGGVIDAERLLDVSAGRDIHIDSTTSSGVNRVGASDFSHTMIDRLAGLYVTGQNGVLKTEAGRDITLTGSEVVSAGSVGINAGRDLQLDTLDLSRHSHVERDSRNYITEQRDSEAGSRIRAEDTLIMDAGQDIIARAAEADAGGALVARAGNDIRLEAGEASQRYKEEYNRKHSGFLSSKTTQRRSRREESEGIASQLGGDTVFLDAGRDLDVIGSEVISDRGTTLSAGGDIGITPSEHYANEEHYEKTSKSGVFTSGASITLGSQSQSLDQEQRGIYHSGSTVGAIDGDVNILAGGDYRQIGSDVLAPGGDINIAASSINIVESHDSLSTRSEERMKQGGLSLGVSGAVVTAINTVDNMREASRNTDSERMQGLAAAGSALHLYNNADDLAAAGQALASGDVSNAGSLYISIGGSSSKNVTETDTRTARGSNVLAGGDVTLVASGEGADSDLHIRGSEINAGGQANLAAEGDLLIESAENTSTLEQDSRNHSGSIGISIGQQTGITVAASVGRGEGEGDGLVHTNSLVKGDEGVRFVSGGDTRLEGARLEAPQVQGEVGGDLTIASRQDTSDYESSSFQAGGSITIGPVSGGSLSISGQKVDAEYASVTEQSGIFTGDGGFQIDVEGNTDLIGGAIASTDKAVEEGRNRLDTASITTKDIVNQAEYDGQGIG